MKFHSSITHSSAALVVALLLASQPYDAMAINRGGVRGHNDANNMISSSNITNSRDLDYLMTADNEGSSLTASLNNCSSPLEKPIFIGCYKQFFKNEDEPTFKKVASHTLSIEKATNKDDVSNLCANDKCKNDRFIGVQRSQNPAGKHQFICLCLPEPSNKNDASLIAYGDCHSRDPDAQRKQDHEKMDFYFSLSTLTQGDWDNNEYLEAMARKLHLINLAFDIIKNEVKKAHLEST